MFSEHPLDKFRHVLYIREDYLCLKSCLLTLLFSLHWGLGFLILLLSFLACPVWVSTPSQVSSYLLLFLSFSLLVCNVDLHSVEKCPNHTELVGYQVVWVPLYIVVCVGEHTIQLNLYSLGMRTLCPRSQQSLKKPSADGETSEGNATF